MDKLDYRKELKPFYQPPTGKVVSVEVPPLNCLMVDGRGDPNTSIEFSDAITALYSVSYCLKFTLKKAGSVDYSVMPLEALWWSDDMDAFVTGDKTNWLWTALIVQPPQVDRSPFERAFEEVR